MIYADDRLTHADENTRMKREERTNDEDEDQEKAELEDGRVLPARPPMAAGRLDVRSPVSAEAETNQYYDHDGDYSSRGIETTEDQSSLRRRALMLYKSAQRMRRDAGFTEEDSPPEEDADGGITTNYDDEDGHKQRRTSKKELEDREHAFNLEYDLTTLISGPQLEKVSEPTWIVKDILVEGQLGVIGGPMKSMKTSLAIDLAVSLAKGQPFLGTFAVPHPRTVFFLSAESDQGTVLNSVKRICDTRNLGGLPQYITWRFVPLPLGDNVGSDRLTNLLSRLREECVILNNASRTDNLPPVVIIDPFYLNLQSQSGGLNTADLFEMGKRIHRVVENVTSNYDSYWATSPHKPTVLFVHHSSRRLTPGAAMSLRDLTGSGLAEQARQWIMVNRVRPYRDDGQHSLIMTVGGSVGHSSRWGVQIDEGPVDEKGQHTLWGVTVSQNTTTEHPRSGSSTTSKSATESRRLTDSEHLLDTLKSLSQESATTPVPYQDAMERAGLSSRRMQAAVDILSEDRKSIKVETVSGARGKPKRLIYLQQ